MVQSRARVCGWVVLGQAAVVACGAHMERANENSNQDLQDPVAETQQEPAVESQPEPTADETPTLPSEDMPPTVGVALPAPDELPPPLSNLIFVGEWVQQTAPAACVAQLTSPISGCDPALHATWDLDCDADGVADHVAYECDPANTERGPAFTGPYDCAPNDPNFSRWVAADADGDGAIGTSPYNCASNPVPEGYVQALGYEAMDCDDAARDVFPGATETLHDGVDSDCGNADAPSCQALKAGVDFARTTRITSVTCAQADLQVQELGLCGQRCSSVAEYFFVVSNTGAEASPDGVNVQWSFGESSGSVVVPALAPGETSEAFSVQTSPGTTRVELAFSDCTPQNNQLEKFFASPRCFLR